MLVGSAAAVTELTSACKPSTVFNEPKLGFTFCTLGLLPAPVYLVGLGIAPTNVVTEALSNPPNAGWLGPGEAGHPDPFPSIPKLASLPLTPNALEFCAP